MGNTRRYVPAQAPYSTNGYVGQEINAPRKHLTHSVATPIERDSLPLLAKEARESPIPATRPPPIHETPPTPPWRAAEPSPQIRAIVQQSSRFASQPGIAPLGAYIAVVPTDATTVSQLPLPHRLPKFKVLLLTAKPNTEAERTTFFNDVAGMRAACMKNIPRLQEDDIRSNLDGNIVSTDVGGLLLWLLDPEDTVPGDMLILIVTGHGTLDRTTSVTRLDLYTSDGKPIDTTVLNSAISKLPAHCTLEIVMGICHGEGMILGLRWITFMGSTSNRNCLKSPVAPSVPSPQGTSRRNHGAVAGEPTVPTNCPPATSIFDRIYELFSHKREPTPTLLDTKAVVILWGVQLDSPAFTEGMRPGRDRQRQFCVLIGAIYRAWNPKRPCITRREIVKKIEYALRKEYEERERLAQSPALPPRRHLNGTVVEASPIFDPNLQIVLMLSNVDKDDEGHILDTPIFQPLDPPLSKSLSGNYVGKK